MSGNWRIRLALGAIALGLALASAQGQAFADHVSCGDVITEDTTLDSDVPFGGVGSECPRPGTALTIGADNVTLDLAGHEIRGGSIGVLNEGHDGVRIEDGGVFPGCGSPVILFRGADHNVLKNLRAGGGCSGVWLEDSDENRLVGNDFGAEDGGLQLRDGSDRNVIARNLLHGGVGGGLDIYDSDGNIVTRNFGFGEASFGPGLGVHSGSDNTTLRRNILRNDPTGGGHDGISVEAGTTNTLLVRNQVTRWGLNVALFGPGDGIQVDSPSTTLIRNSSNDNTGWGILAVPGVIDGGGNTASGNGVGQCLNVAC
jgi:Right handed beta helix region